MINQHTEKLKATLDRTVEYLSFSQSEQRKVEEMTESIHRSWTQIKQLEAGELPAKPVMDFINEL